MLKSNTQNIVVVGAGGTGSWLLPPLTRFLAAEGFGGRLYIADGDAYSEGNLLRQEFSTDDIGQNKANVWGAKLRRQYMGLNINSFPQYISDENLVDFKEERSVFLLCVDNHGARARITRLAKTLRDVVVISGGNEMFDGNVHIYVRRKGEDLSKDVVYDHSEIAKGEETGRGDPTKGCDFATAGSQLLVANFWSAAFMFASFHKLWVMHEAVGRRKNLKLDQEINWNSLLLKCLPQEVPELVSNNSN